MDVFVGVLLVLAAVAVVTGIRLNTEDPAPDGADPPVATQPPPELELLAEQCRGEKPYPRLGSAGYQGPGPHPFVLFESGWPTGAEELNDFAPGWEAATFAEAQLVVCVDVRPLDKIRDCRFVDNDGEEILAPVFTADYTFRFLAAATGEQLGEQTEFAEEFTCPTSVLYHPDEGGPGFEARLDKETVTAVLAAWVEKVV